MPSEQRKSGLLRVIKTGALPVLGGVAFAALFAAGALVYVIGCVASDAALWCGVVATAEMAGIAGRRRMCAAQRECGLVVIVLAAAPAKGCMTADAYCAQLPRVRIVLFVAAATT